MPKGDGAFYSGKALGFAGVLASRRVKLWRDAVNDYELLALADGANPKGTVALIGRVTSNGPSSDPNYRAKSKSVETFVTNNVEDLLRARRIAAALAGGQPPTPGLTLAGSSSRYIAVGAADRIAGVE